MRIARIAPVIALSALAALVLAGPGYRLGLWGFPVGFEIMQWAAIGGLVAVVLALVFLLNRRTRRGNAVILVATLVIGVTTVYVPWDAREQTRAVPPIHDITTDTDDPPAFNAVVPLREGARNPPAYPGDDVAEQQREAYPDLEPRRFEADPARVFEAVLETADALGWEVVDTDEGDGRIEAVATSTWFGFRDDVVVRITDDNGATRVDVRSKSRVGQSDAGANAERIERFLEQLEGAL